MFCALGRAVDRVNRVASSRLFACCHPCVCCPPTELSGVKHVAEGEGVRLCVCACVGVHNCLYATPAACMYLHSHFNLCARRRPTGPQTMSLVLCALTCYMQMRFLPACPATSTHTVHTRRCCSCCCSHFSCCCCLLLSLLLVICRRVRGRLRVRTNKYCNDVCDFFYAPSCATQKQPLYLLPCLPISLLKSL